MTLCLALALLLQTVAGGQCAITVPSATATQWTVQNVNLPEGHPNLGQVRSLPREKEVGDYCLADNPSTFCDQGAFGQCTANDIRLAQAQYVSGPKSCVIGKTIQLTFAVQWISTSKERYDVSAYVAMDGGAALTGSCYGTILYGANYPNDICPTADCNAPTPIGSASNPSSANGPYLEQSSPFDECRDLAQDQPTWQTLDDVPFICRDSNNDGTADISVCLGWQNNKNEATCNGIDRAIVTAGSKCHCQTTINIQGLTVCSAQQTLCYGTNGVLNDNVCEPTFSARFKVTTAAVASYLPASSVLYGNLYLDFQDSNQRMAIQYFDPAGTISSDSNLVTVAQTSATDQVVREDILWPCKSLQKVNCGAGCSTIFTTNWIPRLFREGPYTIDTANSKLSPDTTTVTCPAIASTSLFGSLSGTCARKYNIPNSPATSIDHVWYTTDASQGSRTVIHAALQRDGTVWEFVKPANHATDTTCSVVSPSYTRGITLTNKIPATSTAPITLGMPWNLPCASTRYNFTKFDNDAGCSTTEPLCEANTEVAFVIDAQTSIPLGEWRQYWLPYVWRTTQGFDPSNAQTVFGFCFSAQPTVTSPYCTPAALNSDDLSICQSYLKVGTYPNSCGQTSTLNKAGGTTDFRGMIMNALSTYFGAASSKPRRLVVLVGGPDAGSALYTWGQVSNAAAAGNVQIHAVGIGAGSIDTILLQNIVGTTGGTWAQWASADLLSGDNYLYRRLCPAATPICDCSGFCACANGVGVCPALCNGGSPCNPSVCDPAHPCSGCVVTPGAGTTCSNPCFQCNDLNNGACDIAKQCPEPGSGKDTACTDWQCAVVNGQAVCQGTPKPASFCNDGNGCTADSCVPYTGCVYNDRSTTLCNDGNVCTNDLCTSVGGSPVCSYTPINVQQVCGDNNACTNDVCVPGSGCANNPITCNDNNACTTDRCDSQSGCVFTPINCDDNNACTTDTCDSVNGCQFNPVNVASFCNDNNACTDDTCDPAIGCKSTAKSCDDGNACTVNKCDTATGCDYSETISCSDGLLCTDDTCDTLKGCVFTTKNCNDGIVCTTDQCNTANGNCEYTEISGCNCDLACETVPTANACQQRLCVQNDSPACAVNWIEPYSKTSCEDAQTTPNNAYCGLVDLTATLCPSNACGSFSCEAATGKCIEQYTCDDKNACTSDQCDPATGCKYDPLVTCETNVCFTDTCDPADGKCKRTSTTTCQDNNICTNDRCIVGSGCDYTQVSTFKTTCEQQANIDKCNTYACDPVTNSCVSTPINCDDSNKCSTDTCDSTSGCKYVFPTCDDSNSCTTDSCDTTTGNCKFTPIASALCQGCAYLDASCPSTDLCNPRSCVDSCDGLTGAQLDECSSGPNSVDTIGYYCASTAVTCPGDSTCTKYSCDSTTGQCVSSRTDLAASCDTTKGCAPQRCIEGSTTCVTQSASNPCSNVELANKCAKPVCQDVDPPTTQFPNGFQCIADQTTRDCTDYTCIAEATAQQPLYIEYVIGADNKAQFELDYASRGGTCAALVCTIDTCDSAQGCVNSLVECEAPLGTCNVTVGCFEEGNAFNFPPGVCQLQVDQSLIDFCGVCFGDYASCFFQTVVPVSTVAGIAGGVVAGIVIAAIIAAALIFWLTKKGYDYYQMQSQLNAVGLQENPTFQANTAAQGVIPD